MTTNSNNNKQQTTIYFPSELENEINALPHKKGTLADYPKTLDKFVNCLSYIYIKTIQYKEEDYNFAPISTSIWHSICKKYQTIMDIKKLLLFNDYIISDHSYEVGVMSKGYMINERLMNMKWEMKVVERIYEEKDYDGEITDLELDMEKVYEKLAGMEDGHNKNLLLYYINNFNGKFIQSEKCGRIFGDFNQIKKEFRQYIKINGEENHEVDINGCFFWILSRLAKDNQIQYEDFARDFDISRKEAKFILLKFLGGNGKFSRVDILEWMENKGYSNTVNYIKQAQRNGYRTLIYKLMREESNIMVPFCLKRNLPCIHDAVLIPKSRYKETVRELIKAFKAKYGAYPSMKKDGEDIKFSKPKQTPVIVPECPVKPSESLESVTIPSPTPSPAKRLPAWKEKQFDNSFKLFISEKMLIQIYKKVKMEELPKIAQLVSKLYNGEKLNMEKLAGNPIYKTCLELGIVDGDKTKSIYAFKKYTQAEAAEFIKSLYA